MSRNAPLKEESPLVGERCVTFQKTAAKETKVLTGTHQMDPASPIQALGVNPFPSRVINRTIPWEGFAW